MTENEKEKDYTVKLDELNIKEEFLEEQALKVKAT